MDHRLIQRVDMKKQVENQKNMTKNRCFIYQIGLLCDMIWIVQGSCNGQIQHVIIARPTKRRRGHDAAGREPWWLAGIGKWMTPSLFDGTTAADETYFCHDLGEDRARERLKTFRDTFIQRRDFAEIADHGFNAVRIPVPFFIFEDIGPYIHCYEYLDRAFEWAEEFQLKS